MKIIISGGGTGGHIFPAIAIARAVQRNISTAEILFVGAHNRMEMEKVPAEGFRIIGLPIAGLQRRNVLKNITFLPKLFISLAKCRGIIKAFKPDVVVGVGGYASGPLLRIAQKMNIPTLIQEQNSYAGLTNKLLAAKAKKICVAYSGMDKYFPEGKIVLTGNPIRKDLQDINLDLDEANEYFKIPKGEKCLLIVGGSLGARTINESIAEALDELIRKKVHVIWQTGKFFYERAQEEVGKFNQHKIQVHEFVSRMDFAYSVADIIISRAGAGTISELCSVGKPVILVPSPNVTEDHQTKNAMALVNQEAAMLVKDSQAKMDLIPAYVELLGNDQKMIELAANIKVLAKPNAAQSIFEEIVKIIKPKNK